MNQNILEKNKVLSQKIKIVSLPKSIIFSSHTLTMYFLFIILFLNF